MTRTCGTDSYTYDGAGRRTTAAVSGGGGTTTYLYDGSSLVLVSNPTASRIVSLPGSNEILTIGGLAPIHDALGSTLDTVNSSGAMNPAHPSRQSTTTLACDDAQQ